MRAKEFIVEDKQQLNEWIVTILRQIASLLTGQAVKQTGKQAGKQLAKQSAKQASKKIGLEALKKVLKRYSLDFIRWAVYAFSIKDIYNVIKQNIDLKISPMDDPMAWAREFAMKIETLHLSDEEYWRISVGILTIVFARYGLIAEKDMISKAAPKDKLVKAGKLVIETLGKRVKGLLKKGTITTGDFLATGIAMAAGEELGSEAWDTAFATDPEMLDWSEVEALLAKIEQETPNAAGFVGPDDMPEEPGLEPVW